MREFTAEIAENAEQEKMIDERSSG